MEWITNQQIFEQKDDQILYEKSHIRKNLSEWLCLEEEDFFWEIPSDMEWENIIEYLQENMKNRKRVILAYSNPLGVHIWNRDGNFPKVLGKEIQKLFDQMGFTHIRVYYPYPNCDYPMKIYSDDYLPKKGELRNNRMRNFEREIMLFRDEEELFDRIIEEEQFPIFSNSYLLVAEKEEMGEFPIFVQYANDRAPEFQMKTEIWKKAKGYIVTKKPMTEKAKKHCEDIFRCYEKLEDVMADTDFRMNQCQKFGDGLTFEFLEGKTLDEELKGLLQKGEKEQAIAMIQRFVHSLLAMADRPFEMTKEFGEIFGTEMEFDCALSMQVTDIDLIFRNIILDRNWNVIDYEWTFDFPIPVDFVIYRTFQSFLEKESGEKAGFNPYEIYGISEKDREVYKKMELHFQQYVSRNYHTLDEMYLEFGKPVNVVKELLEKKDREIIQLREQIDQMEHTKIWRLYRKYRNWRERK
ncbi:MAG: hypothetical protein HFI37_01020 [Lachnospiraceae bacterium]|nr:hypothetical protein [Lachnospiraceae bacterium]